MPAPRAADHRHKLLDILTVALFAVICGADDWVAVVTYGRAKYPWLKTFLDLPYGIPVRDTFGDVFARLKPQAREQCFMRWMSAPFMQACWRRCSAGSGFQQPIALPLDFLGRLDPSLTEAA